MDALLWYGVCAGYLFMVSVTGTVFERTVGRGNGHNEAVFFGAIFWWIALPIWAGWMVSRDNE